MVLALDHGVLLPELRRILALNLQGGRGAHQAELLHNPNNSFIIGNSRLFSNRYLATVNLRQLERLAHHLALKVFVYVDDWREARLL